MDNAGVIIVVISVALGCGALYWLFTRKPSRKDELYFFEKPYGVKFANREQIKANFDELERKGKLAAEERMRLNQQESPRDVLPPVNSPNIASDIIPQVDRTGEPSAAFKWAGWHKASCPLCSLSLDFQVDADTELESYEHDEDRSLAGQGECPFCKTKVALTFDYRGRLELRDIGWDSEKKKYYDKDEEIEGKITDFEFSLEDDEDLSDKQRATIESKIAKLREQQQKLEESFNTKDERYEDKRSRWQDKAERRFGDDGFA